MEILSKKLSVKDVRTLKIGAAAVVCIILSVIATSWLEHWGKVRRRLSERQAELRSIVSLETKQALRQSSGQAGLLATVPVFEMPQAEEKQKYLFRNKVAEQIKKAGIETKPLEILPNRKSGNVGYKLVCVKCSSEKCRFGQILDLLAALKENPYLVGIEELNIKCDPQKQEEFKLDIVVSTFAK